MAEHITNMSNEEYHAHPAVSRSRLKTFAKTPYGYWYEYLSGHFVRKEKEAWIIGELVHTMLMEPGLFNEKFFTWERQDRRTRAGKIAYEQAFMDAGTRSLVSNEDVIKANSIVETLYANPIIKQIVTPAEGVETYIESSIFWTDSETGIKCKCRPDLLRGSLVGDLKTTKSANPREMALSAVKYGYYLQAGMVSEGLNAMEMALDKYVLICAEKEEPFDSAIYILEDDAIEFGRRQFRVLLRRLAECIEKNVWPSYGISYLNVPAWAEKELDNG